MQLFDKIYYLEVMKRILIILLLHLNIVVFAQTYNNQDCITALNSCDFSTSQYTIKSGRGDVKDIPEQSMCVAIAEGNSAWFKIEVIKSGELVFDIIPNNLTDVDFAIYDLTNNTCSDIFDTTILPVRCNYSAMNSITGLRYGFTDSVALVTDSAFCAPLIVDSGDVYALYLEGSRTNLLVDRYVIDFSQSTALLKQDAVVTKKYVENTVIPTCPTNQNTIGIHFEYPVSCNNMDSLCSVFQITGPTNIIIDSCRYNCYNNQIIFAELSFTGTFETDKQYLFHFLLPDSTYINEVCGGDTTVFLGVTSTPLFIGIENELFDPVISDYTITPQRNDFEVKSNTPYFAFESVISDEINIQTASTPFVNRFIIEDSVGTFEVCVVGKVLCNRDTVCRMVTISPNVGIAENQINTVINVFPNPSGGIITINSEVHINDIEIQIYDLLGKQVFVEHRKKLDAKEYFSINLSENPDGIYFIKLYSPQLPSFSKKIILSH
jgi:hypothetical protein